MPLRSASWIRFLVHAAALAPLAVLLWHLSQNELGANPIREIQLRTGRYALVLLVLSLGCTPAGVLSGIKQILPLRRTLGLYAFLYASLHLFNFLVVDYGLNIAFIREGISNKPYALVGLASFLILLPLAVTSTRGWRARLGDRWKRLHRLVYLAALLAVLHLLWQVKAGKQEPLIYAGVLAALLIVRLPWVMNLLGRRAQKVQEDK